MLRRMLVLGLALALLTGLAATAALSSGTNQAEAQSRALQMDTICLEVSTALYKGSLTGSCPPGHITLNLPDSYPLSLCASAFDGFLRAPLANGQCPPYTRVRIELPSEEPYAICYVLFTARLRLAAPYPNGTCTTGSQPVTFPNGFAPANDTYQTLGNVDIAVPEAAGVLANDGGQGLSVTGTDTSGTLGTVAMNADGSFTYLPPAPTPSGAFAGDDTFSYTVEDALGNTGTGTVTIQVLAPAVWFVDADAVDPGDGRRETPLNSLAPLNDSETDPDQPGDFIFLFTATQEYEGAFFLEDGQSLVGQEVALSEILANVIEGSSTLQGAPATSVPPFMVLPPADTDPDAEPLLVNANDEPPLFMAQDSLAAGTFVLSSEVPAVVAIEVENTTLDRMDISGGDSLDIDSAGQTGVILEGASMTITGSVVRGGNAEIEIVPEAALQGFGSFAGGVGVEAFGSDLTVIGSTISGGTVEGLIAFSNSRDLSRDASRALQGCCVEDGDGGAGIFALGTNVDISAGSVITGGDGNQDGGYGGDGIQAIHTDITSALQGSDVPSAPPIVSVSASTVTGGAGGSDPEGEFTFFGGDGGTGIYAINVYVSISEGSEISGGNGGDGEEFGGWGGRGISWMPMIPLSNVTDATLQGIDPSTPAVSVLNSTVNGGHGGNGEIEVGGIGSDALNIDLSGFFIPLGNSGSSSLAGLSGDLNLFQIDGATLTAGDGGDGGQYGNDGGRGLFASFDFLSGSNATPSESTLLGLDIAFAGEVSGESVIRGGAGGTGTDFEGGYGGSGIVAGTFPFGIPCDEGCDQRGLGTSNLQGGIPPNMVFNLTVSDSEAYGGPGGQSELGDGGYGGFGITNLPFTDILSARGDAVISPKAALSEAGASLQGIPFGASSVTLSNVLVRGGDGGSGGYYGGDAGLGFVAFFVDLSVDAGSDIAGGTGGSGPEYGGWGGEGIATIYSTIDISGESIVTGGAGGASDFYAGFGGDGLFSDTGIVTISDASLSGGAGGDSTDAAGEAGYGGYGVHVYSCDLCLTLTITDAEISGGNGGDGGAGIGGEGGEGVYIEDDSAVITGSTITGGDGGHGALENGDGAEAVFFTAYELLEGDLRTLDIQNNALTGGTGDSVQNVGLEVEQESDSGSICVNAVGNTSVNGINLENDTEGDAILGITQDSIPALSAANNGATVNVEETITFNCGQSTR